MDKTLDREEILQMIKDIFQRIKENDPSKEIDIDSISENDDFREMDMDSLDIITYRFAIDQDFKIKIPDQDYEDKELAVVNNLVQYISEKVNV